MLTERQRKERELHDRWAEELNADGVMVEPAFEAITAPENGFALGWMGPLAGKRILDLGAGAGEASIYFASHGAHVTALDISSRQLDVLNEAARLRGVAIDTLAVPAEELPFPDGHFDLVYGDGVLHHVDMQRAVPEVRRVLRPGGRGVFIEPLTYNPLIWVYRRLAEGVRTPDERPFRTRDIKWVISNFARGGHREYWISALMIFVYFWLGERVSPSGDRYWKKVRRDAPRYAAVVKPLFALDRGLARIPGVRMLAWNTVIHVQK